MLRNIRFQFIPASIFRADVLAPGTDWKKSPQSFYLGECLLQPAECELKFALGLFLLRHIQRMADNVGWIAVFAYHQVPVHPDPHFSVPSYDSHVTGILTTRSCALQVFREGMPYGRDQEFGQVLASPAVGFTTESARGRRINRQQYT